MFAASSRPTAQRPGGSKLASQNLIIVSIAAWPHLYLYLVTTVKWCFLAQSYHRRVWPKRQHNQTWQIYYWFHHYYTGFPLIPLYQLGSPPLSYHEKYAYGLSGSSHSIIKAMHCTINPSYPRGLTIIIFIVNMAFSQHFNNNLLKVMYVERKGWYYICGFPLICEEMCFLLNLIWE